MSQGYNGFVIPLVIAPGGMASDFSDVSENPSTFLLARNVTLRQGLAERAPGSVTLNANPLPGSIVEHAEFFPNDFAQRVIALCSDGNVYKVTPWFNTLVIPSSDGKEISLTYSKAPAIVRGGAEQPLNARKAFIFSGNNQVQVISGDGTSRRNISSPAIEWTAGNYPQAGMIFSGSLWAWGCPNAPHTIFVSNPNNHEDFTTLGAVQVISLFPGESDRIVDGFGFKTRPYFTKYPRGLYYVDTSGSTFFPVKLGDSFGASNARSSAQAIDDMYIANSAGSISSLTAVLSLGGTEQGDVLRNLKNASFASQYMSAFSNHTRRTVYYEDKKQVMVASSSGGTTLNRLYVLDFSGSTPIFYFYDKDSMTSLNMIRDVTGIPRPVYGGSDGFFYNMDSPNRNVNGASFLSEIQTHNLDFKWVWVGTTTNVEEKDKQFDYVALTYEPTGNWNVTCDAYVDGNKRKSLQFNMSRSAAKPTFMDGKFPLDLSSLVGKNTVTRILPLGATGKKLRLRIYTSGLNQNFRISAITVYARLGGQNNRGG